VRLEGAWFISSTLTPSPLAVMLTKSSGAFWLG
jgi:hypothetical protein